MVPEAHWVPLDGLGHCPMLDDAQLTTKTILEFIQRADVGSGAQQPAASSELPGRAVTSA